MPKMQTFQNAFNRGELDPALFGRNDWQPYFSGAKKLRNMFCRPQGGAIKRGGTQLVTEALDQEKPSVLIRFRFSVSQVYLLEFSDYRFRVLMDGGIVHYPDDHQLAGQEVIIETPYSAEQMQRVNVTQTEDVMILTHPEHRPRSLTRKNHHIWEFDTISFGASVKPPSGVRLTKDGKNGAKYVVSSVKSNNEESLPGDVVPCTTASGVGIPVPDYDSLDITQCRELWINQYGKTWPSEWDIWTVTTVDGVMEFLRIVCKYYGTTQHGDSHHLYNITYTPDGREIKIDAYDFSSWWNHAIWALNQNYGGVLADMRNRIKEYVDTYNDNATVTGHSTLNWNSVANVARYRVYRSFSSDSGLVYYLLGETTKTTFDDDNLAFKNNETPQTANDPFSGPGDYPGVCTFHEQRLVLGRTDKKPGTIFGSRLGAWRNFNRNDADEETGGAISDSSAYEHTLYAEEANEILWLKPMAYLLAGTTGGEFRISGGGGIITATNVSAPRQSNYGCSPIMPVVVGQSVVGVGNDGRVLRAYKWKETGNAYEGSNVSHYAGHLFRRRRIVSLAYQHEPESIIWAVMSDGSLLSCTYMDEEQVLGWSRHDTEGKFEAVVNVASLDGEDDIYFQVVREIGGVQKRFIERLADVQDEGDDIADAWYVDCGIAREGDPAAKLGGLQHLEGKTVVCLGDGNVYEGLAVTNGTITLPVEVRKAVVGLPYVAEVESMDLEPLGGGSITHMARRPSMATVLLYHSRECLYGSADDPQEIPYYSAIPGEAVQPKTARHTISIPAPRDSVSGGLWLASRAPVPFGVLSVAVEFEIGIMAPGPGRDTLNA